MENKSSIPIIDINASTWNQRRNIYRTILPALGAPGWHGANINALVESIIGGRINAINPPFVLRILGTANLPRCVTEEIGWLKEDIENGREEFRAVTGHFVHVNVEIVP